MIRRLVELLERIWRDAASAVAFCPVCGAPTEDGSCTVCDWSEDDVE